MILSSLLFLFLSGVATVRADFRAAAPLVLPRTGHLAVALDDTHLLFLGGASWDDRTAEIYDTTSGVSRLVASRMLANHFGGAAVRLADGRVLIAGGGYVPIPGLPAGNGDFGGTMCELFDPVTEQFTATGALPERRQMHTATRMPDGTVLVAGGETQLLAPRHFDWSVTATCERYDPATGTWRAAPPLLTPRSRHAAVLLPAGRVLFAGGSRSAPNAEIYDDAGASVALSSNAGTASAALLRDGRVFIATGSSYELVDPATATVTTLVTPPAIPGQTATLLGDGSVLLVGGNAPSARFGPVAGTIVYGAAPLTPRTGQTATAIADGSVLIAGGGPIEMPLASVERFVLATASSRVRAVRK